MRGILYGLIKGTAGLKIMASNDRNGWGSRDASGIGIEG